MVSIKDIEAVARQIGDLFHPERVLSVFAVAYRYPGESATREQAKDAIRRCRRFRHAARQALEVDG
jgi:hypothetical protein